MGGFAAILGERIKWNYTAIKNVGYFLITFSLLIAGFVTTEWYSSRRNQMRTLASGRYEVVEGSVEKFLPMHYDGRKEESFTISGRRFRYSDSEITTCFNQSWAHGGPIYDGVSIRIEFIGPCILRIEALAGDKGS